MEILGLVDVPWWTLLIALIIILWYLTPDVSYFRKQGIPCLQPLPLIGTLYVFLASKDMVTRLRENNDKARERGCLGGFLGRTPILVIFDDEMLSQVLVKEFSTFPNRVSVSNGTLSEKMLIGLQDNHWRHVRNEMTPTFSTGKLKKMNTEVNRCAKSLAGSLMIPAKSGEIVEVKEFTGGFTMDVIASTAFGIRVDSQKDRNNPFVVHAKKGFEVSPTNPIFLLRISLPPLNKLLIKLGFPLETIPVDTQEFFYGITRKTMEMRKEDNDQARSDFLQLMLNAQKGENIRDDEDNGDDQASKKAKSGSGLSTDEILANAMLFFIAGYDTTATTLSCFLYNMALNPECQAKLIKEIDEVAGDKDLVDYGLTQEMPYLEQCINETLRLFPPLPQVDRVANRDIKIKDIFIKKGVMVSIPILSIHYDPERWPNPDKFDPERFSAENKRKRNPYHFIPFGNGPRSCIGMRLAQLEMKVAIISIFKKVKVSTCEKTMVPMQFSRTSALLRPKGGIYLKVELRT